jgi:glycosidase
MPLDRNNRANDGISVEEQDGDPASLLNLYRSLGQLRHTTAAMRSGQYDTPKLESPLYLVRHWDEQTLIVAAVNFTAEPLVLRLDQAIPPESKFNGAPTVLFRGDELDALRVVDGGVQIAAGRYVVLRWTR